MRTYILRRLLFFLPVFFAMSVIGFVVQRTLPGNAADQKIQELLMGNSEGDQKTDQLNLTREELKAKVYKEFGYDRPLVVQYAEWFGNALTLNFGESRKDNRPALEHVIERIPIGFMFGFPAFILSYLVCIPLGVTMAVRDKSRFDKISNGILFFMYSTPAVVASLVALLVFCTDRYLPGGAWFPLGGVYSENYDTLTTFQKIGDVVYHLFLPVLIASLPDFTQKTQLMKASFLDNIRSDYVKTARAKGLSETKVLFKHTLRNAILPLFVGVGGVLGLLLSGSVVIETIFGIPGFGKLFVEAIASRDDNVMMLTLMMTGFIVIFGKLLSDLSYVLIDPRIDFSSSK